MAISVDFGGFLRVHLLDLTKKMERRNSHQHAECAKSDCWINRRSAESSLASQRGCRLVCRFSDAGNDVVARMLWRPASEKRQGTKSRSEVHRWCGGLYRELTAAHELEAV
jgi:hypothetical protein